MYSGWAELSWVATNLVPRITPLAPHERISAICLAVVMPVALCGGIGIDLEVDTPLEPELWDTILRPEERLGMTGAQAATHNAASIRRRRTDGVAAHLLTSMAEGIENEKGGPQGPPF